MENKEDIGKQANKEENNKYSKSVLLKSGEFSDKKDFIAVLLEEGKLYSKSEVNSIVKNYFKRRGM